jgi:hypothetical protein
MAKLPLEVMEGSTVYVMMGTGLLAPLIFFIILKGRVYNSNARAMRNADC